MINNELMKRNRELKILSGIIVLLFSITRVFADDSTLYIWIKNTLTNEVKTFEHKKGKKDYSLDNLTCWINRAEKSKEVYISCSSPNPEGKKFASQVIPKIYANCFPDNANHTAFFDVAGNVDNKWVAPVYKVKVSACKSAIE